jgi:carbamoyltransferase
MQTVRKSQNNRFYELIKSFGEKTNIFCLLNTSLNVMGEPIVETIEDAIGLFEKTPIDSLYIGNFRLFRE